MRQKHWTHYVTATIVGAFFTIAGSNTGCTPNEPTILSIEFDDGRADTHMVSSALVDRGLTATFFVNSGKLELPYKLSARQLLVMQEEGQEIGGHTVDHADVSILSGSELTHQICDDRKALQDLGLRVTNFAYPGGKWSEQAAKAVADCGYESGRIVGGLACWYCDSAESIPPENYFRLRTVLSANDETTLDDLKQAVINVIDNGGGWVQVTFHSICDGCIHTGTSESIFTQWLDWVARERDAGQIVVLTVREALQQ